MAVDLHSMNHNQLGDLIEQAKARQEELVKEKAAKLREKINEMVRAEGFDLEEVLGRAAPRGKARPKARAKFRNPDDPSQTWSGRGKRPNWFHAALAAGKTEKELLAG